MKRDILNGDPDDHLKNKALSHLEQAFVNAYCVHHHAARAAREAGYNTPDCFRQMGYLVKNRPHVKAAINERMRLATIDADESIEILSKVANVNVTNYTITRDVVHYPAIKRTIQDQIKEVKDRIYIEDRVFCTIKMDARRERAHRRLLDSLREDLERLRAKEDLDPDYFEIVTGPPVLIKKTELDFTAIARDNVPIKSYKETKEGVQVELYSTVEANRELLKIAGRYEKDNRQKAPNVKLMSFDPLANDATDNSTT